MYKAVKHTRSLDLGSESDVAEYDGILNNPLCKIITERQVKKKICEFGEEGQLVGSEDRFILTVTYEEKEPV